VQTQTEPLVVTSVKVNTEVVNVNQNLSNEINEDLKIISLESFSPDANQDIASSTNNPDCYEPSSTTVEPHFHEPSSTTVEPHFHEPSSTTVEPHLHEPTDTSNGSYNDLCLVPKTEGFSENMKTLLTSGLITMPNNLDTSRMNDDVINILNKSFLEFPYPTFQRLKELTSSTNLTLSEIKSWFVHTRLRYGVSWEPDEIHDAKAYLDNIQYEVNGY